MSVINNNLLLTPEGYQISRSVRLRSSATAYLNRTQASGNNQKFTLSQWVKRGKLGATQYLLTAFNASTDGICFTGSDQLEVFFANGSTYDLITTAVYRDPSAWYHVVISVDTTQATSANRVQLFVNNVAVSFTGTQPTQNYTFPNINANTVVARIGTQSTGVNYLDGYLTEVNFIDGQALTPSSFGETDAVTGVWKPKKYAGTYGTNGFYLNFSDNSAATAATIGKDNSGNGNNWTPNNISVTSGVTYDSMLDVPTMWADGGNGRGNYATLNPLGKASSATLANGNLSLSNGTFNTYPAASTGIYPASGSWYFEATFTGSGTQECSVGMSNLTTFASLTHQTTAGNVFWNSNNGIYKDGSVFSGGAGKTFTYGDVIGVAYDIAAGTITFYKNGTAQTPVVTGVGASYSPTLGFNYYTAGVLHLNCGQRPFAYTPPTGFKALNTQNLPDSTIKKGNQYFDATTYTGTGSSLSVTNSGSMQPDLVWVKGRSVAYNNTLFDSVRGVTKRLISNATNLEETASGVTAFNSTGFSIGNNIASNENAATYVAWQWKESASAGFDIVTYTGTGSARTIAHSLGVKPSMIIIKNRSSATDWPTWHQGLPNPTTQHFWLNATNAAQTSGSFNSTQPTSSVFSVGTTTEANGNTHNLVAYLFAEVAGYSKFGSYTGNGSADGPFVYCGFRPRFVLIKDSSSAGYWVIYDSSRDTYNVVNEYLQPQSSAAAFSTYAQLDLLSNGFKIRQSNATSGQNHLSGNTYIYAAFAENPFKNSLAR